MVSFLFSVNPNYPNGTSILRQVGNVKFLSKDKTRGFSKLKKLEFWLAFKNKIRK